MPQWPAFECQPPISDWSRFDRLVMDVTNASSTIQQLNLFISDSKKPTRSGLQHHEALAPWSHTQVTINLKQGVIDTSDVHVIHIYTDQPPSDMRVYLDRMLLLEPGELPPPVPTSYVKQFAAIQTPAVAAAAQLLDATAEKSKQVAADMPEITDWVNASLDHLRQRVEVMKKRIAQADRSVLQIAPDIGSLRDAVARFESLLAFRAKFARIGARVQVSPTATTKAAVGFASSMEKVLPRGVPLAVQVTPRYDVALARGETESFQVIVVPFQQPMSAVEVSMEALHNDDGTVFPAKS